MSSAEVAVLRANAAGEEASVRSRVPGWGWLFVIGFGLYVGLFYPGFMSTDSVIQLLQSRNEVYSDWHPPLMAHLWGLVERATVPGPAGMLVLQSALVWGGAYLSYNGWLHASPKAALALFLLLLSPPILGIAGVIWKDILMWGFLLLAVGLAGQIGAGSKQAATKRWLLTAAVLLAVLLAIGVRHNAVLGAVPILSLLVLRHLSETRFVQLVSSLMVGVVAGAACFLLAGAINARLSDIHSEAWVVLPVFDAAGVMARLDDEQARQAIFEQIPHQLRRAEDVQSVVQNYSPRYWRTLFSGELAPLVMPVRPGYERSKFWIGERFGTLSEADLSALSELWLSLPLTYPAEWLQHRLAVFSHVIGWVDGDLWGAAFMQTYGFPDWVRVYYSDSPDSAEWQEQMQEAIIAISDWWFFRPWFYLGTGVILVVVLLVRFEPVFAAPILIATSGVMHELGLFIAAPSPDYRYSHYLVFMVALAAIMMLFSRLRREKAAVAEG